MLHNNVFNGTFMSSVTIQRTELFTKIVWYICPILTKSGISRQIFIKVLKYQTARKPGQWAGAGWGRWGAGAAESGAGGERGRRRGTGAYTCGRWEMTNSIGASSDYAKGPKNSETSYKLRLMVSILTTKTGHKMVQLPQPFAVLWL